MADLDDLNYTSIIDMSNDEAIDTLRQIRLSRRVPDKPRPKTVAAKQTKAKTIKSIDSGMAAELLALLTGGSDND